MAYKGIVTEDIFNIEQKYFQTVEINAKPYVICVSS